MTANVARAIRPKTAVYKLYGSLAALVKESTWVRLLNGDAIGVLENDRNYWSLLLYGVVVETVAIRHVVGETAEHARRKAVEKFAQVSPAFKKDADAAFERPTRANVFKFASTWSIVNGYPNVIHLSPENIAQHRREGMDALKLSNRMRELIKQQVTLSAVADEMKFGITREGKD
jgi:uncharacterized membrane protein